MNQVSVDDRALSNKELLTAGDNLFYSTIIEHFGFLIRLQRILGSKYKAPMQKIDKWLLGTFPLFRFLCQTVLVDYKK